jgi:hypothetical protein
MDFNELSSQVALVVAEAAVAAMQREVDMQACMAVEVGTHHEEDKRELLRITLEIATSLQGMLNQQNLQFRC